MKRKASEISPDLKTDETETNVISLATEASSPAPSSLPSVSETKTSPLTPEQRETIEKKRQLAYAKLLAKRSLPKSLPTQKPPQTLSPKKFSDIKTPLSFANLASFLEEKSWIDSLSDEFAKPYFKQLTQFLISEDEKRITVYPSKEKIFRAFNACPFSKVRVVLIGQDPYHGPGQAEGLSFSVAPGIPIPSSLQNIFKELKSDLKTFRIPTHGSLIKWSEQGVLLLNATLTVPQGNANGHSKVALWKPFTDTVIQKLNSQKKNLVFLLWGAEAQKKASVVNSSKHCVLKTSHPSGLSCNKGFFGSQHFSKCNDYLKLHGETPIDWQT